MSLAHAPEPVSYVRGAIVRNSADGTWLRRGFRVALARKRSPWTKNKEAAATWADHTNATAAVDEVFGAHGAGLGLVVEPLYLRTVAADLGRLGVPLPRPPTTPQPDTVQNP